jgi:hypothetical protein
MTGRVCVQAHAFERLTNQPFTHSSFTIHVTVLRRALSGPDLRCVPLRCATPKRFASTPGVGARRGKVELRGHFSVVLDGSPCS